jgi:hypothetical protein
MSIIRSLSMCLGKALRAREDLRTLLKSKGLTPPMALYISNQQA